MEKINRLEYNMETFIKSMGEIGVDHKDNASGFETQFTDES
jgi:hypothetical protein